MTINGTKAVSSEILVFRNENLLTTEVDGELMAMSVDRGVCFGLNSVGTRIWTLLAEPQSVDTLCAQLLREFDVEKSICRREVGQILQELLTEGLVTLRGPE